MARVISCAGLVLVVLLAALGGVRGGQHAETELRRLLLADYDSDSLPERGLNLSLSVTILGIDMDEQKHTLFVDVWMKMKWYDRRLMWNNESYPGIEYLSFSKGHLWRPDLSLYNNADMGVSDPFTSTKMLLWPHGKVLWVPTARLPATCVMDLTYWPHDVHNCIVKVGSWVHSQKVMDLKKYSESTLETMIPKKIIHGDEEKDDEKEQSKQQSDVNALSRGTWILTDKRTSFTGKIYSCCPETYVSMKLALTVKRNAPAYSWMVKVPAVVLSLMTSLIFMMPPGSTEKLVVGCLLVLLQLQFLAYVDDVVVLSPSHTPLIVQYVSEQVLLTGLFVLLSAVLLRVVSDPHADTFPRVFRKPVALLERVLFLSAYRFKAEQTCSKWQKSSRAKGHNGATDENAAIVVDHHDQDETFPHVVSAEWLLLGALLDRIFLILYLLIFIIKLLCYCGVF
ncbi:neuronal acetylcholine receptor subunit alpha-7 [Hyalella azteca]|uniref:Neuronal acetylcholine receptor subunit alpha-7 n=1 Tax=Hyalella azteca TaxID=294128 RepID=A0A8B7NS84_HYAAZ|nr:neuronal acetylcholine receptor subunit alpha-7 [Hyalella azteca]